METTRFVLGSLALFLVIGDPLGSQVSAVPNAQSGVDLPDLRKVKTVDGIDISRYQSFWNDWKLVTVRFRKDNGEQRFVYANAVAWKAMRDGITPYPDGAMFGKVAFAVGDDPSFPNSLEPRTFARIQFMRKDSRAYATTNGWGYALIVRNAVPTQLSDRGTATACHACHSMVPERNFVFSRPGFLDERRLVVHRPTDFKARFHDQKVGSLSAFERRALSHVLRNESLANLGEIKSASMALFSGSVNESVGVLSRYATEDKKVYALWDAKHQQFAIARPLPPSADCKTRNWVALTLEPITGIRSDERSARVGIICDGKWHASGSVSVSGFNHLERSPP